MKATYKYLRRVPIFHRLSNRDLKSVAGIVIQRAYKKGDLLFAEGSRGDTLYIIVRGKVKIFKEAKRPGGAGKIVKIFEILSEGEFLGEMALLNHEPRCASAMAMEDCWIYLIQKNEFTRVVLKNPEIALTILEIVTRRLREADVQIQDITFRNIPGRLATLLLKLADKFGRPVSGGCLINVRLTHEEFSQMVGTSRVYTSKYLSEFRREGSIRIQTGKIVLLDRDKLKTWI